MINATIEDIFSSTNSPISAGSMDVIHSHHVIEHVYDIDKTIINLRSLLKEGGLLFILVPNWIRDETMLTVAHSLIHLRHFSVESMCLLLQKHGFLIEHADDRISIVARKTRQTSTNWPTLLPPQQQSYKQQVRAKILREVVGNEHQMISERYEQSFFMSNKGHRYEMNFSTGRKTKNLLLIKAIKEQIFGVVRDRSQSTSLFSVKAPKSLFQKYFGRILRFDKQEVSGLIKIVDPGDENPHSPLVEYKYEESGGITMIK